MCRPVKRGGEQLHCLALHVRRQVRVAHLSPKPDQAHSVQEVLALAFAVVEMQRDARLRGIPVVVVSAHPHPPNGVTVVPKPFHTQHLLAAIKRALERRSDARP
jgi:hypothetical protein